MALWLRHSPCKGRGWSSNPQNPYTVGMVTHLIPPQKEDPQVKLTGNISHIVELCLGLIENPSSMNRIEEQPKAGLQPWAESLSSSRYAGPLITLYTPQRICRCEHEPQLLSPVAMKGLRLQARGLASLLSISQVIQAGEVSGQSQFLTYLC